MLKSYRQLIVWQKAVELVVEIYKLTELFPKSELFGIVSQMRRAAISIPSNIAEGSCRGTRIYYRHFLMNAFGSGAELETQIEIAKHLPFGTHLDYQKADEVIDQVMRMLNSLMNKLKG